MWLEEQEFFARVLAFWQHYVKNLGILPCTFSQLVSTLHGWVKGLRPNFKIRIEQIHSTILEASKRENLEEQEGLMEDFHLVLREQELYWLQKSKVSWLLKGDRNTRFFHLKASARHLRILKRVCLINLMFDALQFRML